MSAGSSRTHAERATQEFKVRIGLTALPWVSDDLLEDLTICVEDALSHGAAAIAPGASGCANFLDRAIELDFVLETTPSEVHRLVGEAVRTATEALDAHAGKPAMSFGSSATSLALVQA
jgi:hypothetical protein